MCALRLGALSGLAAFGLNGVQAVGFVQGLVEMMDYLQDMADGAFPGLRAGIETLLPTPTHLKS